MSSDLIQPLQGMSDIDYPEVSEWQRIERVARQIFSVYFFSEIRTPILERTEVFTRSIGNTTDIVQKEMYTFQDRGGRSLTMRPEGTAGVVRYLAGKGQESANARLYYIGPMFRAERPQAGRKRQFHQCGVEIVGGPNPLADAECMALQLHLLEAWGLRDCVLQVNTRGAGDELSQVGAKLKEFLVPHSDSLCEDCRRRMEDNVFRVLDCKNTDCADIVDNLPMITDLVSPESRAYFNEVAGALDMLGVAYTHSPRLVRGLDYYNHTIWEISHPALGAQDALAGGGRYTIAAGKKHINGVGFAMGIERVLMALCAGGDDAPAAPGLRAWLVSLGDKARRSNFGLLQMLRSRGVSCSMDMGSRSMKAQMRSANQAQSRFVVIRGDDEIARGICLLKDMESGEQIEVGEDQVLSKLKQDEALPPQQHNQ